MKYRTKKLVLEVMEYTGKNENKFRKFINATAPIVLGMKKGVWALKRPDGESIFISKENLEEFFEPVEETVTDCNQSAQPTTNSSQLPRLTAEVFDRPDCPVWAKFAAVSKFGCLTFFEEKPVLGNNSFLPLSENYTTKLYRNEPGRWDATDWQNSLIERPTKLPDWCKVGEWIYYDDNLIGDTYAKVKEVTDKYVMSAGDIGDVILALEDVQYADQARLRPFNADEMRGLVGKVIEWKGDAFMVTAFSSERKLVVFDSIHHTADDLIDSGYTIDGKPCGVFEHLENGEWVE